MAEYTPAGRPSAFTLPDGGDSANLITILEALADDTLNAHGDTVTGSYTITGTVDATTLKQAGVAVVLVTNVGVLQVCTSSTRPGTPSAGQLIFETDTLAVKVYDGSIWTSISGGGGASYNELFLLMGA